MPDFTKIDFSPFEKANGRYSSKGIGRVRLAGMYNLGNCLVPEWYGNHRYSIADMVEEGENELKIKLTTTLFNYIRTQENNPEISRWLNSKNPEPSGLVGPVRIYYQ